MGSDKTVANAASKPQDISLPAAQAGQSVPSAPKQMGEDAANLVENAVSGPAHLADPAKK